MKAVYYQEFGGSISLETVPDPSPAPDGVVLRVTATGLCRSDWHGWQGHDADIHLPHVPGHELAGVIEAVGSEVRNWQPGARVTLPFCGGCGDCPQCHAGHQQICDNHFQPGFTAWGSFAEYVAIRYADVNLVALPESITDQAAASLGCRFITSYRAVVDQGRVRPEQWVAVHGCGGVGLSAIMIAAARGAQVIAVDIHDEALQLARSLGASHTLNATETDVVRAIQDLTAGGAHLSIDALGHPQTCSNSIAGLRKRGRHVQVGLIPKKAVPLMMGPVIAKELEIVGSHGMQAHRYPQMLAEIEASDLQPDRLLGRQIHLPDLPGALMTLDAVSAPGVTVAVL